MKIGEMTGNVKAVYESLPRGCEHPLTATKISDNLSIKKRDVYSIINTLIMAYDIPVGGLRSDNRHGYFIITNEGERYMAVNPLEHHANEIMARVSKLKHIALDNHMARKG